MYFFFALRKIPYSSDSLGSPIFSISHSLNGLAARFLNILLIANSVLPQLSQRLHQLQTDYTVQQTRLTALWSQVVAEALKDLGERVSERLRDGQAVAPGRPTSDLWIECAEEQFARAAHSTDYAKAQADLANTAARLRIEQRRAVEVLSRQLDLPTRAELDTVHRRIKTLTAQLRALEDQLPPARKPARKAARTRRPARP